jgi:hypothetical protein
MSRVPRGTIRCLISAFDAGRTHNYDPESTSLLTGEATASTASGCPNGLGLVGPRGISFRRFVGRGCAVGRLTRLSSSPLEDKGMVADINEHGGGPLSKDVEIRCFATKDADAVCDLFVRVNQHLAPPGMAGAFDEYIARSLAEEIDHIIDYYGERRGGFWVAVAEERVAGIFGLEPSPEKGHGTATDVRRSGISKIGDRA